MERSSDKIVRNTTAIFQEAIVRKQKTKAGKFSLALLYERLKTSTKDNLKYKRCAVSGENTKDDRTEY